MEFPCCQIKSQRGKDNTIFYLAAHFTISFCQKHFYTEHGLPWPPWYRLCESRDVRAAHTCNLSKCRRSFPTGSCMTYILCCMYLLTCEEHWQVFFCMSASSSLHPLIGLKLKPAKEDSGSSLCSPSCPLSSLPLENGTGDADVLKCRCDYITCGSRYVSKLTTLTAW